MKGPIRAANPGDDPIEVSRNAGKPTRAAELAKALAETRKKGKPLKVKGSDGETTDLATLPPKPAVSKQVAPPTVAPVRAPPTPMLPSTPATLPELSPEPVPMRKAASKPKTAQLRFVGMKPMHVVEAALFAAGKPILVEEIVASRGLLE